MKLIAFVNMQLIKRGGAWIENFFEYPEFNGVLKLGYNLVVVMLGDNDISTETVVRVLSAKLFEIHNTIESYGAIEKREYPINHPHYVDPEVYRKIMNFINKKLTLKGK